MYMGKLSDWHIPKVLLILIILLIIVSFFGKSVTQFGAQTRAPPILL